MNRNYRKKSNDGKMPIGFYFGIIFALLGVAGAMPALLPIFVVAAIVITTFKRMKNVDMSSINKKSAVKAEKPDAEVEKFNTVDLKNKTDSQKRLETLKSLYQNGFMEKDEYEAARKRFM